jgi:hypothetical protein
MRPQLHSPPMSSAGRLIVACLAVLAAGAVMLGCGSGDSVTSADIDPQIATDLTGQLDKIQTFLDEGNCDRAIGAVDTLRGAISDVSGSTGEQFTNDAMELTDKLAAQVEDQCQPAQKPTSSTTEPDTVPTTTDTVPTTTTTTTTTKSTTTKSTTTSTTTTPTGPPGNTDNTNGNGPGGGVVPGGKKENSGHTKKPKPDKHGKAKDDRKERNR